MDAQNTPIVPIAILQNENAENIFDINIDFPNKTKDIHSYEVQLMIFPYSRLIAANNITIYPFQELQNDLEQGESNTYSLIQDSADKGFGILISFLIFLIFLIFNPNEIFSIQSIISILSAYAIGKEFWRDLDNFLVNFSKNKNIRFLDRIYKYQQNQLSTIFENSRLAELRRYGIESIHPDEFSLISSSNNVILRTKFDAKSLNDNRENHFGSFHVKKSLADEFLEKSFLIGSKITINKKVGFVLVSTEYFQTFDNGKYGAVKGRLWHEDASFVRYTISIWRLKMYLDIAIKENTKVLEIKFV